MIYRDKLPDYIDNLLSPDEMQEIRRRLEYDDELRDEYIALKAIIDTAAKSADSFAPSRELQKSLFTTLGIGEITPETVSVPNIKTGFFEKAWLRYAAPIAASIALFFAFTSGNNTLQVTDNNKIKNTQSIAEVHSPEANTIANPEVQPAVTHKSKIIRNRIKKSAPLENNVPMGPMPLVSSSNANFESLACNEYSDPNFSEYDEISEEPAHSSRSRFSGNFNNPAEAQFFALDMNNQHSLPVHFNPDDMKLLSSLFNTENFVVELKNTVYFNVRKSDKADANFNNVGIAVLYKINDKFYAGIDIRDESFNIVPDAMIIENMPALISMLDPEGDRDVNVTTIGLAVRYVHKSDKDNKLFPSADLIIAKNSLGTVGRANLAISFEPVKGLTATAGIEAGILAYNSDNVTLSAPKLGINYGLAYNF